MIQAAARHHLDNDVLYIYLNSCISYLSICSSQILWMFFLRFQSQPTKKWWICGLIYSFCHNEHYCRWFWPNGFLIELMEICHRHQIFAHSIRWTTFCQILMCTKRFHRWNDTTGQFQDIKMEIVICFVDRFTRFFLSINFLMGR